MGKGEKCWLPCLTVFSKGVFYLFEELTTIFINLEIAACKLSEFGRVHNLSTGKGSTNCSET